MDIDHAYEIYRRITTEYQEVDRIPEIFTDDFVGGNASFGRIRGVEAQTIFLRTAERAGLVPEDHLWYMASGNQLAFRARNWAGAKHESAFFDVIGNLTFDPARGKFSFYYGFYDPRVAAEVLASGTTVDLNTAAASIEQAQKATQRFVADTGDRLTMPDEQIVSFLPGGSD
jgi:hypothetical protein